MIKRLAFLDVRIMIAVPSVFNRLADLVPAKTVWTYSQEAARQKTIFAKHFE